MSKENNGWLPIESAPKDQYILLFPSRWYNVPCEVGKFDNDEYAKKPRPYWRRFGSHRVTDDRATQPTYWRPLPKPPAEG